FMGNYNVLSAPQAAQLLGLEIQGKLAIRPESIYVRESGREYAPHISKPTPAIIKNHQLLGNVIRYQVQVKGCEIAVDLLNRSSERLLQPGSKLELLFNLNELQQVS
ncbi:MAG: putative spermidine/putrescine transport system ATP-binding protein, partial [Psychromonas sp.]|uniref:TOBE domain-containing protein n=1 Tax=Psychromonas sp. TaxID=1884585 RepID=UPI0039E707C5